MNDVSKRFEFNPYDAMVSRKLTMLEETPKAIQYFSEVCDKLTDYSYWFLLSTLWVSYTGFSSLDLWKKLFSAKRRYMTDCIMKPSELEEYHKLPTNIKVFRVHRKDELDWIAYTLNFDIAKRFCKERNVNIISEYIIKKKDITALFLRREEDEIIMLNKNKAKFIQEHSII